MHHAQYVKTLVHAITDELNSGGWPDFSHCTLLMHVFGSLGSLFMEAGLD